MKLHRIQMIPDDSLTECQEKKVPRLATGQDISTWRLETCSFMAHLVILTSITAFKFLLSHEDTKSITVCSSYQRILLTGLIWISALMRLWTTSGGTNKSSIRWVVKLSLSCRTLLRVAKRGSQRQRLLFINYF